MNDAHLHLLINHFPIIGLIIGAVILLAGVILSSSVTKKVALAVILLCSLAALPTNATGEGAEEVVEQLDTMTRESHRLIHEHEEIAERFMLFIWGLIVLSITSLILEWKKVKFAKYVSILTLLLALFASYIAREVGTSGGEISHPEIRKDFVK